MGWFCVWLERTAKESLHPGGYLCLYGSRAHPKKARGRA